MRGPATFMQPQPCARFCAMPALLTATSLPDEQASSSLFSTTGTHLSEMDISSSTVTGRLTCPEMANSLVPWLFLRPKEANHSGPRRRMVGDTATVSTLVTERGR